MVSYFFYNAWLNIAATICTYLPPLIIRYIYHIFLFQRRLLPPAAYWKVSARCEKHGPEPTGSRREANGASTGRDSALT